MTGPRNKLLALLLPLPIKRPPLHNKDTPWTTQEGVPRFYSERLAKLDVLRGSRPKAKGKIEHRDGRASAMVIGPSAGSNS